MKCWKMRLDPVPQMLKIPGPEEWEKSPTIDVILPNAFNLSQPSDCHFRFSSNSFFADSHFWV